MTITSDQKIQQILDAASAVLARKGYTGTTINLVAAEAGVSRGLLHYYFKNKEEMLTRVVTSNVKTVGDLMADIFGRCDSSSALAKEMVAALRDIMETDPDFFNLFFEGWTVARQNQAVDSQLRPLYGDFRKAVHKGLVSLAARRIIQPQLPLEGLAALIVGLIDGLGLQMVSEPHLIEEGALWSTAEEGLKILLSPNSDGVKPETSTG